MLHFMERSTIYYLKQKGWTNVQIAEFTGHHRDTIARVLREEVDKQPKTRQRTSAVAVFDAQITRWLDKGLSVIRMLELARADAEHPYQGGETAFYDYVRHPCAVRANNHLTTWRCALKGCQANSYKSIGVRCTTCRSAKRA
jgi:hypothetical protein